MYNISWINITSHLCSLKYEFLIFTGDMNVDMRNTASVPDAIFSLISDLDLIECSHICTPSSDYTYHRIGLGQRTWIDYFFVSRHLVDSVIKLDIIDLEPNNSDHLPVTLDISLN